MGLVIHDVLFKDTHLVAKDPVKLNNAKKNLHQAFSLNIYEYLKYNQHQFYHYELRNHRHIPISQYFSYFQLENL